MRTFKILNKNLDLRAIQEWQLLIGDIDREHTLYKARKPSFETVFIKQSNEFRYTKGWPFTICWFMTLVFIKSTGEVAKAATKKIRLSENKSEWVSENALNELFNYSLLRK